MTSSNALCPVCDKRFKSAEEIVRDTKSGRYCCQICWLKEFAGSKKVKEAE